MEKVMLPLRQKIADIQSKNMFLPERCRSMEGIVLDLISEIENIQRKLEKIQKVLGE
jgi:hypothetical protein